MGGSSTSHFVDPEEFSRHCGIMAESKPKERRATALKPGSQISSLSCLNQPCSFSSFLTRVSSLAPLKYSLSSAQHEQNLEQVEPAGSKRKHDGKPDTKHSPSCIMVLHLLSHYSQLLRSTQHPTPQSLNKTQLSHATTPSQPQPGSPFMR